MLDLDFFRESSTGMVNEVVEASANSHSIGDDFDHLIAYFTACTLEDDVGVQRGMRC